MERKHFEKLSDKEQRAYYKLYKVTGDSPWAITVYEVTRYGDQDMFRQMLVQLRSQAVDNPQTMKEIIGESAFDAVMECEESFA